MSFIDLAFDRFRLGTLAYKKEGITKKINSLSLNDETFFQVPFGGGWAYATESGKYLLYPFQLGMVKKRNQEAISSFWELPDGRFLVTFNPKMLK